MVNLSPVLFMWEIRDPRPSESVDGRAMNFRKLPAETVGDFWMNRME